MRRPRSARSVFPISAWLGILGTLVLVAVLSVSARSAEPQRSPRRYIPARDLVAYLDYDGLDVHAKAWQATAAYDMLLKTPAGAMLTDVARQLTDSWIKQQTNRVVSAADVEAAADLLVRNGFALAFSDTPVGGICVLKDIGRPEHLKRLDPLRRFVNPPLAWVLDLGWESSRIRGRTIYWFRGMPDPDERISAWFEDDDLIVAFGEISGGAVPGTGKPATRNVDMVTAILDTIEGKRPNVTTHPGFVSALAEGKDLKGFEPDGLFFLGPGDDRSLCRWLEVFYDEPAESKAGHADQEKSREAKTTVDKTANQPLAEDNEDDVLTPEQVEALGFNGIKRIVGRWGLQDRALVADVRIEAPAPRKGAIACFDQPAFRTDRLPSFPAGVGTFLVGSIDLDGTSQKVANVLKLVDPDSIKELEALEKELHAIGLRLREDVLQPIGPSWFLVEVPPAKQGESKRNRPGLRDHVLVASIKDADEIAKVVDKMLADDEIIRCGFLEIRDNDKRVLAGPGPSFEPLPRPDRGYRFTSSTALTDRRGEKVQPAVLIGRAVVVLAWNLEQARRVVADLDKAERWKPTGELAHALEVLPRELTFLSVMDNSTSSVPDQLADLPRMIQILINQSGEPDLENASIWALLDVFGAPRPGGLHVRVDRSKIPSPDRIRKSLFPSVLAIASDDRGFRIIGREPLPFIAIAGEASYRYSWTAGWRGFLPHFEENFSLTFPRFDWDD